MKRSDRKRNARQLVILTGLSGSGKGTVLNTFEDLGFYCVDNLPVALIPTFSELYDEGRGEIERAALLVDAREGEQLEKLPGMYRKLRSRTCRHAWFSSKRATTALHAPFQRDAPPPSTRRRSGSVAEGIREERRRMAPIRTLADVVIDTTKFNVHELRQFVIDRFQNPGQPAACWFRW